MRGVVREGNRGSEGLGGERGWTRCQRQERNVVNQRRISVEQEPGSLVSVCNRTPPLQLAKASA